MKTHIYLLSASVLVILGCSQSNTSEEADVATEEVMAVPAQGGFVSQPLSHNDSLYFQSMLEELKGIEKFAVGSNFFLLTNILNYKGETDAYAKAKSLLDRVEEYPAYFEVIELDAKNGYVKYAPIGAEVTYTKVYWNLEDGSQLIATESWGCGPICESEISFAQYKDGIYKRLQNTEVVPEIEQLPPNIDESGDPVEYQFVLPKQGKDIKYCLDADCITLKWADGKFMIAK